MSILHSYLGADKRLIAAKEASDQFEALVQMFAGPKEKARWHALRDRLEIYPSGAEGSQTRRVQTLNTVASLNKV